MTTIQRLQVRHIRGARKVDIHTPDRAIVEIAGKNGAGKSSALDAVEWGLRGKRALPVDPLHHGATEGSVTLDLGDLQITRRINEGNAARGGTVRIQARDGTKRGQRDLDELYGLWTFDPLAFAHLPADKQVNHIRQLAGREFCDRLEALETEIASVRESRTEAGRVERSYGRIEAPDEVQAVDVAAVLEQVRRAHEANARRSAAVREAKEQALRISQAEQAVTRAAEQLARAQENLRQEQAHLAALRAEPPIAVPSHVNVELLERELASATEINRHHAEYVAATKRFEAWQDAARKHTALSERVTDLEEERRQHLRTATLPVEGLSWEGSRVALHGIPFPGLSTTEQLLLSARIGMAMSPHLRVMLIREGGLIDDERFAALRVLAETEGYQIWIETAGDGHTPDALMISNGGLDDSPQDDWTD